MRILAVCAFTLALAACSDSARVYPVDPTAMQAGTPKIQFERYGMGRGPVTVTMPDGEILHGEYQVTENAAVGIGFAGTQTETAIGYGSNRHVVISATGDRTIMNCDGTADIGGHGSGICQTGSSYTDPHRVARRQQSEPTTRRRRNGIEASAGWASPRTACPRLLCA
jgi:hypothetical protein